MNYPEKSTSFIQYVGKFRGMANGFSTGDNESLL
jgi:hypothetical protein